MDNDTKIPQELQGLINQGTITHDQAVAVMNAFSVSRKEKHAFMTGERFLKLLSVLGAILIGIGVILFFAANWRDIPPMGKTILLVGSTLAAYGIGYFLRYHKQTYATIGEAVFLIGAFLYGTSIFLILQTYHVRLEYPNEILFWLLGILPLGYLLMLRSVAALAHGLFLFWFGYALINNGSVDPMHLIALYIPLGAMLVVSSRIYARSAVLKIHRLFLRGLGYASIGVALFPFSSIRLGEEIYRSSAGDKVDDSLFWALYIGLLLFAGAAGLAFFVKFFPKGMGARAEIIGAPFIALMAAPFFTGEFISSALGIGIFFNMLLLMFLFGMIIIGYWERQHVFVNLGIAFLGLYIFVRYIEFIGDLLEGATFFIVGGLLLLGLAVGLSRLRKEVLKKMQDKQASIPNQPQI